MTRLYAIVSDIHGNFEALKAVEADARRIADGCELQFICLGDVVDYGPRPNECMDWVRQHATLTVLGNHDREATKPLSSMPKGIGEQWWPITLWTRRALKAEHKAVISEWKSVKNPVTDLPGFTLFHSHLRYEDEYTESEGDAEENLEKMRTDYGVFGHTHLQGYFEADIGQVTRFFTCTGNRCVKGQDGWNPVDLDKWHPLPTHGIRALFNPGSVGRPRQHDVLKLARVNSDPKAAYMLMCFNGSGPGHFMFRRVPYDWHKTAKQLRQLRWHQEHAAHNGSSVDIDRGPILGVDSYTQRLYDVIERMDQALPELVEEALAPRILTGE